MSKESLVVGEFHIDTSQNRLILGNRIVYLGPLRTSILHCLCKNLNTVVTRDALSQLVWGRLVSDHTITQHISQLRKNIATLGMQGLNVCTIPKRGYSARMASISLSVENQVSHIKPEETSVKTINNMSVLVVKAEAIERKHLIEQLEILEVTDVESVATAAEAERSFALRDFDLIIVDSLLAENAGVKLIKRIRTGQTAASNDICILNTHFDAQRELIGLNSLLDVQGLLLKPFETSRLKQMLMVVNKSNIVLKPQAAYELVPTDVLKYYEPVKAVNE